MSLERDESRAERILTGIYAALLRLYPPSFRREYGGEMTSAFRSALRDRGRRHGAAGILTHLGRTARDLAVNVPAEWIGTVLGTGDSVDRAGALEVTRDELRAVGRSLRRSPGLVATVVPTLALGIGTITAFFGIVNAQLFRPLPYDAPDRLVRVWERGHLPTAGRVSGPTLEAMADLRSLQGTATYRNETFNLRTDEWIEPVRGTRVDAAVLELLGVAPLLGRTIAAGDAHQGRGTVVLLGHELWHERFAADAAVVGRTVVLDGDEVRVIGVMPEGFAFPEFSRVWVPFSATREELLAEGFGLPTLARLADGTTFEAAAAEIDALGAGLVEAGTLPADARLQLEASLVDRTAGLAFLPWLLLGTGFAVLLVVCANVASVLLARGAGRRSEMAVRASLGASPGRLIGRSLLEGLLLALVGGGLGLLLSDLVLRAFLSALGANFPAWFDPAVDARVVAFTVGIATLSVLAFGLPAALEGARGDPAGGLAAGSPTATKSRRGRRLRGSLVTLEVAFSFVLVTAGVLMAASVLRMRAIDTGTDAHAAYRVLLSFSPATESLEARRAFLGRALRAVEALPEVRSAGLRGDVIDADGDSDPSWSGIRDHDVRAENGQAVPYREVRLHVASPGYFPTVGLDILRGRNVSEADLDGGVPVAVVSATLARRLWPSSSALGERIRLGDVTGPVLEVVGVVEDERVLVGGSANSGGFALEPSPDLYVATAAVGWRAGDLYVRPRVGADATWPGRVREALRATDPDLAVTGVEPLAASTDRLRRAFGTIALLLVGLAVVGAALAVMGVWGIIARSVSERTREIGIRTAIGGSARTILGEIMARGVRLTGLGIAVGMLLVLLTTRILGMFLYDVGPREPVVLVGTAVGFALVGLLAAWIPARRATSVDPVEALRAD